MNSKMMRKMATVNVLKRTHLKNDNQMHFTSYSAGRQVLGTFKHRLRTVMLTCPLTRTLPGPVSKMPTPTIRTVMLQELTEHRHAIQQRHFRQYITSALSDVSSSHQLLIRCLKSQTLHP